MGTNEKTQTKASVGKKKKGAWELTQAFLWLLFAIHQGFIAYVLFKNFDNIFVVVAAGISAAYVLAIAVVHFIAAHRD